MLLWFMKNLVIFLAISSMCLSFHVEVDQDTRFDLQNLIGKPYLLGNKKTFIVFNQFQTLSNIPKSCYHSDLKSESIFAYIIKYQNKGKLNNKKTSCKPISQHFNQNDKKILKKRNRLIKSSYAKHINLNDYEFKAIKHGFELTTNINTNRKLELYARCNQNLKASKLKILLNNESTISLQIIGEEGCAIQKSKITQYLNKFANMIDFAEKPKDPTTNIAKTVNDKSEKIWNIIQMVILAVLGMLLMTMGIKIYNCSLAAFGFVIGAALAYIIMQHYSNQLHQEPWLRIFICLISSQLLGPIFYKLFVCLTDLVALLIGAVCGLIFALAIISAISKTDGSDINWGIRLAIFIVSMLIVGGVSYYYDDRMIIANTAIFGVYVSQAGLFNYLKKENEYKVFLKNMDKFNFSQIKAWQLVYMGGVLVFFVIGLICQCSHNEKQANNPYRKLKEDKPSY